MTEGITELISDFKELHPCAYKRIRDNAIDEFVNALLNYQSQDEDYKSLSDVCYEIAEQLKGGAE